MISSHDECVEFGTTRIMFQLIYVGLVNDGLHGDNDNDTIYSVIVDNLIADWNRKSPLLRESSNNCIYKGDGSNEIYDVPGHDRLYGWDDSYELWGDSGNDEIHGAPGDDRLWDEANN